MDLIVGVDGSELGMQALEDAVARTTGENDSMLVAIYGEDTSGDSIEAAVRNRLDELGAEATIEQLEADAAGALVERAERGNFDQIVLPGGERSPLGKIQFDSTVEFVLLNARTSVTLVR